MYVYVYTYMYIYIIVFIIQTILYNYISDGAIPSGKPHTANFSAKILVLAGHRSPAKTTCGTLDFVKCCLGRLLRFPVPNTAQREKDPCGLSRNKEDHHGYMVLYIY